MDLIIFFGISTKEESNYEMLVREVVVIKGKNMEDKKTKTVLNVEDYKNKVTSIEFSIGGYFQGHTQIKITKNENGAIVHVEPFILPPIEELSDYDDKQISEDKWNEIVSQLYDNIRIHNWKTDYTDIHVLDGTQWSLEIKLKGRKKQTYSGSNAYPPNWSKLKKIFKEFGKI